MHNPLWGVVVYKIALPSLDVHADEVDLHLLGAVRQQHALGRDHVELLLREAPIAGDAQGEAHRDLRGIGQRQRLRVEEAVANLRSAQVRAYDDSS